MENLPGLNRRVYDLINEKASGNETSFARMIGMGGAQKLNRLFRLDSRRDAYPTPSTDILLSILNRFEDVSADWLLFGVERKAPEIVAEPNPIYESRSTVLRELEDWIRNVIKEETDPRFDKVNRDIVRLLKRSFPPGDQSDENKKSS